MLFKKRTSIFNLEKAIEGCKRRNSLQQRLLFENYASYAKNICMRYSSSEEEAEESLSDGFLKIFDKIDKYRAEIPFEIWLRKIMINTAIDSYRKNKKDIIFENIEVADNINVQEENLSAISANEIMIFVQRLPRSYQTVFSLYVVDGYSHAEIANILEITESASRANLTKARAKLQEWIKEFINKLGNG